MSQRKSKDFENSSCYTRTASRRASLVED